MCLFSPNKVKVFYSLVCRPWKRLYFTRACASFSWVRILLLQRPASGIIIETVLAHFIVSSKMVKIKYLTIVVVAAIKLHKKHLHLLLFPTTLTHTHWYKKGILKSSRPVFGGCLAKCTAHKRHQFALHFVRS